MRPNSYTLTLPTSTDMKLPSAKTTEVAAEEEGEEVTVVEEEEGRME